MNRVAENIRKVRENAGMSAKTLGKKLGVAESYIIDIEAGRKVINEGMIGRISKILGKNVSDLGLASFEAEVTREERSQREKAIRERKRPEAVKKEPQRVEPVSEVWSQAFGDNLRNVPIFTVELRTPLDNELYPITDGKIEDHPAERVVMVRFPDDSMEGYGIMKDSDLMGIRVKEALEEGYYLIETDEKKIRKVRNLGNGNLLIMRNSDREYTETRPAKEVKVFMRFFMVKRRL